MHGGFFFWAGVAFCCYLAAVLLLCLCIGEWPRLVTLGRRRPRGGSLRLAASPGLRAATTYTTEAPQLAAAFSSSCTPPGGVSAGWEIPRRLRDPSRLTGRGWSTHAMEDLGASGRQPPGADSPEVQAVVHAVSLGVYHRLGDAA